MAVNIQSKVNGILPLPTSRNDVRPGDTITLEAIGAASTFAWSLTYKPQDLNRTDSSAVLIGPVNTSGPITFVVDFEGSYLIRLLVDLGLPSQAEIFVRIRALTKFGKLSLVGAGERRDETKVPPAIPFDASSVGWANDQNYNINVLRSFVQKVSSSGRVIYVDANRGKLNSNTPNTPNIAEGFADFSTITEAITAAMLNPAFNGGVPPTVDSPILIVVRPGLYEEDITFLPQIPVIGLPSAGDRTVTVRTTPVGVGTHVLSTTNGNDSILIQGITFVNSKVTPNAMFVKTGPGSSSFLDCKISQESNDVSSGSCVSVLKGTLNLTQCVISQENTNATKLALEVNPNVLDSANLVAKDTFISGPSIAVLNSNLSPSVSVVFDRCELLQKGAGPGSFGINTNATSLIFSETKGKGENGNPDFIFANSGALGAPGDLFLGLYWSRLGEVGSLQGISFNTTGVVGTSIVEVGASEYTEVTKLGIPPLVKRASVLGESIFYDPSLSGLSSENLQDAVTELALSALNPSLDDAYNNGRIITVDSDAVELVGSGLKSDPPPLSPSDGDGTLRVYSQIEVGAIPDSEVVIYSNNTGNGPSIEMGRLNVNDDSPLGSSAWFLANTVPSDLFSFNMRIGTKSGIGDNILGSPTMGNLILAAGTALKGSVNNPVGGSIFISAGGVEENLGVPGEIFLTPGITGSGNIGAVNIVDPNSKTGSTLQAAGNFTDLSTTPAGTLTFCTDSGKVEITFLGGEDWVGIQSLLEAGTGIKASWAGIGNPIILTTTTLGFTSELILIKDSTGGVLNTYLGDFTILGGAIFTLGSGGNFVSLKATGDQEITIGNGTNDMVYDALTGKLTVPGVIDPTALVLEKVDHSSFSTGSTQGAIFISNGSGGLNDGEMYIKGPNNGTPSNISSVAEKNSSFLTANNETSSLVNSKRLQSVSGQTTLTPSGSDLQLGLANTTVIPGTFKRTTLTVDEKGRITSSSSGALVFDVVPSVPSLGPPPLTYTYYRYFSQDISALAATAWVEIPFVGFNAASLTLDILVRGNLGAAGVFSSVLGGPQNIGTVSNASQTTLVATDMSLKTGPVVVKFVFVWNAIPAGGEGLVTSLVCV